ncbi:hypothetical protein CYMTET_7918 [Cymbomonas tetramitiformis]|uniref:Uncharacterized protein n=1 Tax=Cymbomonas tetramitiformis TaxID=36881 RepID=A0AAE0LGL0_9CHLO|nr:hypothetical protein CYMTET_7918 [Cymbomonas tetramitiformis]
MGCLTCERVMETRCAAAACVSDLGVVDFSEHGHVRAGTIKPRAYDALREKMKHHLTEEQTLLMAQVQPICKLQNATLCEGLALVSSGGELMLYRAILMDTGANCNIISIAVVRRLGLTVYEASTGAKVTRCDNSPTKFTHYCHVDVILAAGTPRMTLHRLYAFVAFEPENSWDLLVGTGPLKNSLMIDIKLGSGVAVSHAPSVLGMDTQVMLPLVDMTPPKRPNSARRVDPIVCLTTEIFGQDLVCGWPSHRPPSAEEERIAASGVRSEHIDDIEASPVPSPSPSPSEPGELPPAALRQRARTWTCPIDERRRSVLPLLVSTSQEESERILERFCANPLPWEGGRKWVREDQLKWPNWLGIDQKLYQDEEGDKWAFSDSYTTHIPSNKRNVIYPRDGPMMLNTSRLKMLQNKVQALQKYPSGEVTGTLMWDLKKRVVCVQPDTAAQYLQPVDMEPLRDGIYDSWQRHGQDRLPLELVQLEPNSKFYPVEDGLGGGGRVFADNASAQEYLHLGEGRKMLKCAGTRESGLAAIRADAVRRPPPPQAKRRASSPSAPAAGAGPSRATAGPSRARIAVARSPAA